ncbi:MAG: hypothetical protein IJD89_06705 [Clostridia bacterium]|nr:hypothetical protein [Clostridia bacterium]
MLDNRNCSNSHQKENICIDTYRVLDSCRDKDCFENVKVFLTDFGEEIIERTSVIRAKCAKIVCAYIDINDVPFNRGFYQLNIKMYVRISFEACVCPGNVQEFDGIAVVEKKVILFGSEGNTNVFKSEYGDSGFCKKACDCDNAVSQPIAVLETVDPIVLGVKVVEPRIFQCSCCCTIDDIPNSVVSVINGSLCDRDDKALVVSLGFFSIVKIERPAQLLISATEYNIPDKECVTASEDDPCTLFRAMSFPVNEFSPPVINTCGCSVPQPKPQKDNRCGCGN